MAAGETAVSEVATGQSPLALPTPQCRVPSPPSVDAHRRGGRKPRVKDVDAAYTARPAHGR